MTAGPRLRPVRWLGWLVGVLAVGHALALAGDRWLGLPRDSGPLRQLDLNAEANLTAWVESTMLLACALLAWALTLSQRDGTAPHLARRRAVLTAALLLMAVDEASQLHDLATGPLRRALDLEPGPLWFAWLIPGLAVAAGLVFYLAPLAASLPADVRRRLVGAGAVYVAGAAGVEMVGGVAMAGGPDHLAYQATILLEETLEMVGTVMLLAALLELLRRARPVLTVRWAGPDVAVEVAPSSGSSGQPVR